MRDELVKWAKEYPLAAASGDKNFKKSPVVSFVSNDLKAAFKSALGKSGKRFKIEGSAGQGKWTHVSWLALLDPAVTATVQEGYYVVYLLSVDGKRLYLTLTQGCTLLKDSVGIAVARRELVARGACIRAKLNSKGRFRQLGIDLGSDLWRPSLYTAGEVVSVLYHTDALPKDAELLRDLLFALQLYRSAQNEGGFAAEDEILKEADEDGLTLTLEQAKRYRQHRGIERQSSHSKAVKKALGTTCMGCSRNMGDMYGSVGDGLIHAHHLVPLSSLADNEIVRLDPRKDFAVLCPNCHSIIHRLPNPGDVAALKALFTI